MKKPKRLYIPYSIADLTFKSVLFEKAKPKLEGVNFCCWLNDVPIYTDSNMERTQALTGSKTDSFRLFEDSSGKSRFLIVGLQQEEIMSDSTVLQNLTVLIETVYKKSLKNG